MAKLAGQVALVTGAASGMGKAQALAFANEGAKIIAVDLNGEGINEVVSQIREKNGDAVALKVNIANRTEVKEAVKRGIREFGKIDILSNTAGILDDYAPTLETSEELWDRIINVNLKSMFFITNEVLPQMIERGKGTVINIASIAGLVAGGGGAAYTTSKHGVIGFTKQLSFDYGSKGIKANAICPGAILTGMTNNIINNPDSPTYETVKSVPAGRYGEAEEVAALAIFLASDESNFIHGAVIPIDGGWTVK